MKNNVAWKAELIPAFNEETLSVEFVNEWKKWVHRDPLVGSFSEMNLFCLQISPIFEEIHYWESVWMVVKHFAAQQNYTGDSISHTVIEHITLNFKGTKMFCTWWRSNPLGVPFLPLFSCCHVSGFSWLNLKCSQSQQLRTVLSES